MRWFFIWIISLPLSIFAQSNLVEIHDKKGCNCKNINNSNIHIAKKIVDTKQRSDTLAACYFHCIGVFYYIDEDNRDYVKSIENHENALNLRKKNHQEFVWKSLYGLGLTYRKLKMHKKSQSFLQTAYNTPGIKRTIDTIELLRIMADNLSEIGELQQAENYAIQATQVETDELWLTADAFNNLSVILGREEQNNHNKKRAIQSADTSIRLYKEAGEDEYYIAYALNNKADALSWLERYDEAINIYNAALNIYDDHTEEYARILNNKASTLSKKGNYTAAKRTLKQSLKIKTNLYKKTHAYTYAANHENLGEIYLQMKDYKEALRHFQLAIDNLKDDPKSETPYIYNKPDLLRLLDLKAQAALKSDNIDLAYETYQVLDEWINEFYKDLSTNESKLTWIARAHDTYAHAIEVALAKNDKEKAFQYAEKAHAVLLWQSLSQQAARNLLSKEDKEKMDNLTAKIRQADQQYRYGEININALRTLERERENLEKTFDQKYPAYAQRKYQPEATTVSDIQSNIIDNQTAFIEYYRTDEILYIFIITKNGLEIIQKNADGLADNISNFIKNISHKNMDANNYHTLAHKLYEQLIPSTIHSNDNIKRLVIVPDREIGRLPFAALTSQATSGKLNKNTPFLVKKYATNYLYSAGSYLQLQQKKADQKYCFAGIAPLEYTHGDWQKLPNSEEELNKIKKLHWQWNREILLHKQATKAEFERIIKEGYRTIQISTHAVFDENKGRIIFHDSALNQDEIDQLEINTHRLILSACETGVGIQNQGEGILSLGWNFAYKGVPSITMSHWSVSDNSTKDIMIHYHKNLNEGIAADQALQNAQQHYLENMISDTQANPHYWAALFHTGNVK